jgi:hypothetical protein
MPGLLKAERVAARGPVLRFPDVMALCEAAAAVDKSAVSPYNTKVLNPAAGECALY